MPSLKAKDHCFGPSYAIVRTNGNFIYIDPTRYENEAVGVHWQYSWTTSLLDDGNEIASLP